MSLKRVWQVYLTPMHIVQLKADEMEQVAGCLVFRNEAKQIGVFNSFVGWTELQEEPKEPASVTTLTVVPKGDLPPGAA